MANSFSLKKIMKVGLTTLAFAGASLMASTASAQLQHFRTSGKQILDPSGQPVFFNGTNLGNWLVWEGYLMLNDGKYINGVEFRPHSRIFDNIKNALGNDFDGAREFETLWRDNYVTETTIDKLKGMGYNSVRVPFNWHLFWNEGANAPSQEGVDYINKLITYCKARNMYILLDMHGAPGYQNPGDHSDNLNSNKDKPLSTTKFLEGSSWDGSTIGPNVKKAAQVWRFIADTYKDEPTIWGYDLLNEPATPSQSDALWHAYKYMIGVIREVDKNHIVVVEGDNWGGYMDMFKQSGGYPSVRRPQLDSNVVLETHHYVFENWNDIGLLNGRAALADELNVPIIIGEIGEEPNPYLREMANIGKEKYDGVFSWTYKKMYKPDRSLWTVLPEWNASKADNAFINLVSAINNNRTIFSYGSTKAELLDFLRKNIRDDFPRMQKWDDYYKATTNPLLLPAPGCTQTPFKDVSILSTIQAEDFDNGCKDVAYGESTPNNEGGSYRTTDVDIGTTTDGGAGYYVGWTAGGEWLEYTVNVPAAGNYSLNYRYATPYNGAYIEVASASSTARTYVNPTAGWDSWSNASSNFIYLAAGMQTIRITFSGGVNLNSFSAASSGALANGTYAIISKVSKKALDVKGWSRANEAIVQQYPYVGGLNQKWSLIAEGDAFIIKDSNSGNVLDLTQGNTADRTKLQTYQLYAGNKNQRWKIEWNAARNAYTIKSAKLNAYNQQIAVDVESGKVDDNLQMQVYTFGPGNINQEWDFIKQ